MVSAFGEELQAAFWSKRFPMDLDFEVGELDPENKYRLVASHHRHAAKDLCEKLKTRKAVLHS